MVFNRNFVVVVKANGKILREMKDVVRLPFGTEYSILLKNLDTRRAVVTVEIDGDNVLGNFRLIIDGNSEHELKRFVVNGDLNTGPRFKFIERTEQISNHRGNKTSDGIIRVEYQFEREVNGILKYTKDNKQEIHNHHHYHFDRPKTWGDGVRPLFDTYTTCDQTYGLAYTDHETIGSAQLGVRSCSIQASSAQSAVDNCAINTPISKSVHDEINESGITTYGNECDQSFSVGSVGSLDSTKHVMCLQLLGTNDDGSDIASIITVKKKIKCNVCGNKNKSNAKFCSECGTNIKY